MSTIDKLISRLITIPKDFSEADLDRIFLHFGYMKYHARSGGSGIKYIRSDGSLIIFHSAHGKNAEHSLKSYVLRDAVDELKKRGHIK